jgi:hypothetical protein
LRGVNAAAEFFGGFEPFLNDDFHVCESALTNLSVSGAAGKLGNFSGKRFVGVTLITLINDDLLSNHPDLFARAIVGLRAEA